MRIVQIRELKANADGHWEVEVRSESSWTKCELHDPAEELDVKQIRWVLEDYPSKYPFEHGTADAIWSGLEKYAESLMEQLQLGQILLGPGDSAKGDEILVEVFPSKPTSTFHAVHWELLEACTMLGENLQNFRVFVTRAVSYSELCFPRQQTMVTQPKLGEKRKRGRPYNVLLVVSRPHREDDIDPLLGAKALKAVVSELTRRQGRSPADFEIVRPGTWKAFESYIQGRTEQWWSSGGHGPWFDVVHFDVHGVVHDGFANLEFLSRSGNNTLYRSGELVGDVLYKCGIKFVVLHACESAKVTSSPRSNLASTLVAMGIPTVIAMSFKLTGTAAQIFLRAFYFNLLAHESRKPVDALRALQGARRILSQHPARLGKLDHEVYLPDYFVPVMYTESFTDRDTDEGAMKNRSLILQAVTAQEIEEFAMNLKDSNLTHTIIGREHNILRLEWLVLREGHPNIALVTGTTGTGKTALVQFLGDWWTKTRLIADAKYWSLRESTLRKIIKYLRAWSCSRPPEVLRKPRLFIIDQLDTATNPASHPGQRIGDEEKSNLIQVLQQYLTRRDLIILVSRSKEDWCLSPAGPIPVGQHYQLPGLSNMHAIALASRIMSSAGWGSFLKDERTIEYLECLVSRLNYLPLSIDFFLRNAKLTADKARLYDPNLEYSLERPDNIQPDSPKNLLHYMLLAPIFPVTESTAFHECENFIKSLYNSGNEKDQLTLLVLVPLSNIYCDDWYQAAVKVLAKKLGRSPTVPSVDEVRQFVSSKLMNAGWAELVKQKFKNDAGKCYVRIHYIFTNALRFICVHDMTRYSLLENLWIEFIIQETLWAYLHSNPIEWKKNRLEVQLRATNLMAACSMCYNIVVLQDCRILQPYFVYVILSLLGLTAIGSSTPALSMTLVTSKMEELITFAEKRLVAGHTDPVIAEDLQDYFGTNIDVMIFSCQMLSVQYLGKSPKKSVALIKRMINQIVSATKRGENWDRGSRRHQISKCLLTLSFCCLQENRFVDAKRAASLALRCYRGGESKLAKAIDIRIQTHAYYILLMAALEQQEDRAVTDWYAAQGKAGLAQLETITEYDMRGIEPEYELMESINYLPDLEEWEEGHAVFERMPVAAAIRQLVQDGKAETARSQLVDGIAKARQTGNEPAEAKFCTELAEISMASEDWLGAATHINRFRQLRDTHSQGVWHISQHYDISGTYDKMYRYARYGSVYLRLEMFSSALTCFLEAFHAKGLIHAPSDAIPNEPYDFVDFVMTIIRGNLCMLVGLPRKLISPFEFNALDDLAQKLLLAEVIERWPEFDIQGNKTAFRLQRKYSLLQAPIVTGGGEVSTTHTVIGLTEIVLSLSRQDDGTQGLTLGFLEGGLELRPEGAVEPEDPDIFALEEALACTGGIVGPDNPR